MDGFVHLVGNVWLVWCCMGNRGCGNARVLHKCAHLADENAKKISVSCELWKDESRQSVNAMATGSGCCASWKIIPHATLVTLQFEHFLNRLLPSQDIHSRDEVASRSIACSFLNSRNVFTKIDHRQVFCQPTSLKFSPTLPARVTRRITGVCPVLSKLSTMDDAEGRVESLTGLEVTGRQQALSPLCLAVAWPLPSADADD